MTISEKANNFQIIENKNFNLSSFNATLNSYSQCTQSKLKLSTSSLFIGASFINASSSSSCFFCLIFRPKKRSQYCALILDHQRSYDSLCRGIEAPLFLLLIFQIDNSKLDSFTATTDETSSFSWCMIRQSLG